MVEAVAWQIKYHHDLMMSLAYLQLVAIVYIRECSIDIVIRSHQQ